MKRSFITKPIDLLLFGLLTFSTTQLSQAQVSKELPPPDGVVNLTTWIRFDNTTKGTLHIRAKIHPWFHIYATTQPKPFLAPQFKLDPSAGVTINGQFSPSRPPKIKRHKTIPVELHEYYGEITWTAPVKIAEGVNVNELEVPGKARIQACHDGGCLAPHEYKFVAKYNQTQPTAKLATIIPPPGEQPSPAQAAVIPPPNEQLAQAKPDTTNVDKTTSREPTPSDVTFDLDNLQVQNTDNAPDSLVWVLPLAFLAGFLLNFMPCVLPVIGIKVLVFLQQAGDSRARAFLLNLVYSLGLLVVMLVLATLAVFAGIGWGAQFSSVTFNVVLTAVVFVFALSFLGVWEIPIPGFVSKVAGGGTADKEGYTGAFAKGVLTTLLATPCSGPFLGPALAWAVGQPAWMTYSVFATVGLGLASPYLVLGIFPKLLSFMPKPGAWMNTFKQLMGFVLLATVVYLLSFLAIPYVVPTVALLVGLGFSCWWIGQHFTLDTRKQKLKVWGVASSVVIVSVLAFLWLHNVMESRFDRAVQAHVSQDRERMSENVVAATIDDKEIPWQIYTPDRLEQAIQQGTTVFVDFTADWCATCKTNEALAIETDAVRKTLAKNGIVPLRADKTQPAPEVDQLLKRLGNKSASIPFYAVFPAGRPNEPITLDGVFPSPQPIVDALEKAGPSRIPMARNPKKPDTSS
ncbi:MAG: protein-disulfide reductase DsbD family protein [Gemmataceae bacterium]